VLRVEGEGPEGAGGTVGEGGRQRRGKGLRRVGERRERFFDPVLKNSGLVS
jgi:hypothetical protein